MSDNVIWMVDLDVSATDATNTAEQVKIWLVGQRIVSLIACQAGGYEHLLTRGKSAPDWDFFPYARPGSPCGLEIAIERAVYHTGDNGIDGLRCPVCGAINQADDLPWSAAVEAWFLSEGDQSLACPVCRANASILDWEFDMPWGFGELAFGFWNWPMSDALLEKMAAITGHRYRVVHEHI